MWGAGTNVGIILLSLRFIISDISADTIIFTRGYTYDTSSTSYSSNGIRRSVDS